MGTLLERNNRKEDKLLLVQTGSKKGWEGERGGGPGDTHLLEHIGKDCLFLFRTE